MTSKAMADAAGVSAEDMMTLIRHRRSAGRLDPDRAPSREEIELLLEAATWAPNHKLTQPWRFFVVSGEGRRAMGELYRRLTLAFGPDTPETRMSAEVAAKKPLRAPVTIVVACDSAAEGWGRARKEDYAACAAAAENVLLAASSMGLAAKWNTGGIVDNDDFKRYFGLPVTAEIVSLIYLGYAAGTQPTPPARRPVKELVRWMDGP